MVVVVVVSTGGCTYPSKVDVSEQHLKPGLFEICNESSDIGCLMKHKKNLSIKPSIYSFFLADGKGAAFTFLTKAGLTDSSNQADKIEAAVSIEKAIGTNNTVLHSAFKQKQERMKEAREKSKLTAAPKQPPSTPMTVQIQAPDSKKARLATKQPAKK